VRLIPENTVDGWTAIHLANSGSRWIWLPSNYQQGVERGTHPGDVSALAGRRLLILENKAAEADQMIDFGNDPRQRRLLRLFEEEGLKLVTAAKERPSLGWVLYGLPCPPAGFAIDGSTWPSFPWFQYLVCPHDLDNWSVSSTGTVGQSEILGYRNRLNHRPSSLRSFHLSGGKTLSFRHLIDRGHIGLPIDPTNPLEFIRELRERAFQALIRADYEEQMQQQRWVEVSANLTGVLSLLGIASQHLTGAIS
jgi:hypothetical protein